MQPFIHLSLVPLFWGATVITTHHQAADVEITHEALLASLQAMSAVLRETCHKRAKHAARVIYESMPFS